MSNFTLEFNQAGIRKDIPQFRAGDKVRINLLINDKNEEKERIQVFEGIVIGRSGSGISETFTVRKMSPGGIGVERTFPVNSPVIEKLKLLDRTKVRRAKLYYIARALREKNNKI